MSEADRLFAAIQSLEDRVTDLRGEIQTKTLNPLSDDETHWVRLAIQREAQSIKLRQAVIEKTLSGLVWSALIGAGYMVLEYFKSHGWKQ